MQTCMPKSERFVFLFLGFLGTCVTYCIDYMQSNLDRSFFTGLEEKNKQNGKNDASGIKVFSIKL